MCRDQAPSRVVDVDPGAGVADSGEERFPCHAAFEGAEKPGNTGAADYAHRQILFIHPRHRLMPGSVRVQITTCTFDDACSMKYDIAS